MPWLKKSILKEPQKEGAPASSANVGVLSLPSLAPAGSLLIGIFPGTGASDTHQVPLMGPHANPMVGGEPRRHNSANPSSPLKGPGILGIRTLKGLPEEETTQSRAPTPGERILSKLEDHPSAP